MKLQRKSNHVEGGKEEKVVKMFCERVSALPGLRFLETIKIRILIFKRPSNNKIPTTLIKDCRSKRRTNYSFTSTYCLWNLLGYNSCWHVADQYYCYLCGWTKVLHTSHTHLRIARLRKCNCDTVL